MGDPREKRVSGKEQGLSALERRVVERLSRDEPVPLGELVNELSKETGCSPDGAAQVMMALESRGLVEISEGEPYTSLAGYAASPLSSWFWGALAATAVSLALLLATSGAALDLRYAFGTLFVLFLPGYALLKALYPNKEPDGLTRFALSIGLSIALVPLVGLVLNYTPLGLRLGPVAASLAVLTAALLSAALARRYQYYRLAKGV